MALRAALGQLFFPQASITAVEQLGARFRRLRLKGDKPQSFAPGDKVQVLTTEGPLRTYTPFDVDDDGFSLLVFLHNTSTPGGRLGAEAKVGDRLSYFGPRGSLPLAGTDGAAVLVGDETAFAVARSFAAQNSAARFVFEVDDVVEARAVVDGLGIGKATTLVEKKPADGHLAELVDSINATDGALFIAGRAQTAQALKKLVRTSKKTKAYWAVGKRGLD